MTGRKDGHLLGGGMKDHDKLDDGTFWGDIISGLLVIVLILIFCWA
jgi:hypothetical protein